MPGAHDEMHMEDKAAAGNPPSRTAHDEVRTDDAIHPPVNLSDADLEVVRKVAEWLREKWGEDKECPMCGNPNWYINPVGAIGQFLPRAGVSTSNVYPVVPVHCSNCGFVALINAGTAGVVERVDGQA
jgi:predicted nucleic-acid-binding Zn-ribbon protein